jgi:hypothetical protein
MGFFEKVEMILARDAEARQDEDVDLRVTEEPEEVLKEQRVAALVGLEERRAEVAVGQEHGERAGENRECE